MKKPVMVALCTVALCGFAQDTRKYIWPEGKMPYADQKHLIAAMTNVSEKSDFKPDEWRQPYIEWCDAPKTEAKSGICMILVSGGGYNKCCSVSLVKSWEERLRELGVTCVNFVYRTPRPEGLPIWQCAWADAQRAVRMVRAEAAERGFDPDKIGVMAMSAGSHLAALLATSSMTPAYEPVDDLDKQPCNINFACTFALAYALTDGIGTPNARDGDADDVKLDSVFKFDEKTCPMWMSHGGKDQYSPLASTKVYRQLRKRKIPGEVHIYPDQGHGAFGFERAVEFMRQMGYFGPVKDTEVLAKIYASDEKRSKHVKSEIWPKGKIPDEQTKVKQCEPYLEWHFPKELKTKAIQIIWSGGSYQRCKPEGYAVAPVRRYLNEKGMAVVTVKYRVPRPAKPLAKHVTAWQDIQRAIRIVRSEAPAYGLDPDRIGIMGSSAGGHLALMGATSSKCRAYEPIDGLDDIPCDVKWAIAIFPAYALTGGKEEKMKLSPEFFFDEATCPVLFIHGDADTYSSMNSVMVWEHLRRMGIQGELHTLATRGHCFQRAAAPGTGSNTWLDRIWEFMTTKGYSR